MLFQIKSLNRQLILKLILPLFIAFLFNEQLTGQNITGLVTDENQQPLAEVNILNITNGQHTHSDEQGTFRFENVSLGDTLQFSHIG